MNRIKKIVIISIIMAVLSVIVIPLLTNLNQIVTINFGNIYKILSKVTDSIIVKASDDYINAGNMLFITDEQQTYPMYYDDCSEGVRLYTVITPLDQVQYEYSLNDAEFTELEYPSYGSTLLNLTKDANTVVVRRVDNKKIDCKALIVKDQKGGYIILLKKFNRWDEGTNIYTLNYGYQLGYKELYEYSMDGGNTYHNIYDLWTRYYFEEFSNNSINGANLFDEKIIVRDRETGEIVYKTPELEDIEATYTYENGKTIVNFKQDGFEENETSYEYEINGETYTGTSLETEEDLHVKLRVSAYKEFTDINAEKDIDVKVVKVGVPNINNDNNSVEITEGEIENDELGDIYYSINGGEYQKYTDKLTLEGGTYIIKAYVVSKNNEIIGEEIEEEITIEETSDDEPNEDNNNDDNNNEDNNNEDNQKEDENKASDNEEKKDEDQEKESNEDINSDEQKENNKNEEDNNKKSEIKKQENNINAKSISPKTSDNIVKVICIFAVIVVINIIIVNKKR